MTIHVAIIGGGIVGVSAAYYLSQVPDIELTLYDEGIGSGTQASAGIISPWLSRRRNKAWYRMVRDGAAFYPAFLSDVMDGDPIPDSVYKQVGTLLFKSKPEYLEEMLAIGQKRRENAPEIGDLKILSAEEVRELIPIYDKQSGALWAEGGARVDGRALADLILSCCQANDMTLIPEKANLNIFQSAPNYQIQTKTTTKTFDKVVLANAAWLKYTLEPLGYNVDIRAQKGQLAELQLDQPTSNWPVVMPEGEGDFIPFEDKVIIGATHEDEQGFDLTLEPEVLQPILNSVNQMFSEKLTASLITNYRIGTRAYTSDYAPFFGFVPGQGESVVAASGLGSTGLTAGPLVGKILSELILGQSPSLPLDDYPIARYIQKK